jgi:hypothetical protein
MQKKTGIMALAGALVLAAGFANLALADRGDGYGPNGAMMGMPNFEAMDADKSGSVTEAEITAFRAGQVAKADADGDGKLNATELAVLQQTEMQERMAARAAWMIERFDSDGDGLLSAEELAAGPRQETMFDRMDADGDGAITEAEMDGARDRMQGWMREGGMFGGRMQGGGMMDGGMMHHGHHGPDDMDEN